MKITTTTEKLRLALEIADLTYIIKTLQKQRRQLDAKLRRLQYVRNRKTKS
ncbi:MAG: hypothetical protein [Arizlama microvirus]|nr:MAG: hypothetical protein [Arizlama microvirus]